MQRRSTPWAARRKPKVVAVVLAAIVVVLALAGAGVREAAHIHAGSCDELGPIAYALASVVEGSLTGLSISLEDLRADNVAIEFHESADKADIVVACADITEQASP